MCNTWLGKKLITIVQIIFPGAQTSVGDLPNRLKNILAFSAYLLKCNKFYLTVRAKAMVGIRSISIN